MADDAEHDGLERLIADMQTHGLADARQHVADVEQQSTAREVVDMADALPENITEDSLALTFCEAYPQLRYVAAWGKWMLHDGTRWAEDSTLHTYDRVRGHLRRCTTSMLPKARRALLRSNVVADVEHLARADRRYAATSDQWDADPWLLNTPGGAVNLRNGVLMPHDPNRYCTKIARGTPQGECPTFRKYLADVTAGDVEYQAYLQRVMGYVATGSTREHAMFFAHGPGGTGKTTLLEAIAYVLGDYAVSAPMETFVESSTDRHPTEIAMLRGARLVTAVETQEGRSWAETRIKTMTGGDTVTARFMRCDFFEYKPSFKLLIAGNYKPRLHDVGSAMRRRLNMLPFLQKFEGAARDVDMGEKLRAEADGIMRWIVEGTAMYLRDGLSSPSVVADATSDYFESQDLFDQWVEQCCERGRANVDTPTRLYSSWKAFTEAAGEHPGKASEFADRLETAGFRRDRTMRGRFYQGLKLRGHDTQ